MGFTRSLAKSAPLLCALALLLPIVGQSATYKWVDEQGVTVYGQNPPPGVSHQKMGAPAKPATDPVAASDELRSKADAFERRRAEKRNLADEQAKQEAGRQQMIEACRRLRATVQTLNTGGRVQFKEGDSYRTLSAEEREARVAELQARIAQDCQGL